MRHSDLPSCSPATTLAVSPPVRRGITWAGAFLGCAVIFACLAGFIFYYSANLPFRALNATSGRIEHWAAEVRDAFVSIAGMQPRVTVDEHVVYEQSSPVLELAVLQREATVERETENTWIGSTKHVRIRGTYRIKAGYDLTRPFTVQLDGADLGVVRLRMPRARLLTVELEKLDVLTMDNGLWNHIEPNDFETEVNAMNLDARAKAWREGMAAEAEKTFIEQVQQKLGAGHRLEVLTDLPEPGKR